MFVAKAFHRCRLAAHIGQAGKARVSASLLSRYVPPMSGRTTLSDMDVGDVLGTLPSGQAPVPRSPMGG